MALMASRALVRKAQSLPSLPPAQVLSIQFRRTHATSLCAGSAAASSASVAASTNAAAFDAQHDYNPPDRLQRSSSSFRSRSHPIVPHPVSPQRVVSPDLNIPLPPYAASGRVVPSFFPEAVIIHDGPSIKRMKAAAQLARRMLDYACSLAHVDRTTDSIDTAVHDAILAAGAYPSPLNYAGFPKSLCSSVNEVICHGIPDARPLERGDVVSFDVSCFLGGVHGDNCATVIVGDTDEDDDVLGPPSGERTKVPKQGSGTDWRGVPYRTRFDSEEEEAMFVSARRLVIAAKESLDEAVRVCRPGGCLSEVGAAVQDVADAYGYDSVQKYRGHGIGEQFHCAPYVKHYRNTDKMELVPGMIFTIEPMLTEGHRDCEEWEDDWTVVTQDGGMAAQFEHTVLITESGVEILTLP